MERLNFVKGASSHSVIFGIVVGLILFGWLDQRRNDAFTMTYHLEANVLPAQQVLIRHGSCAYEYEPWPNVTVEVYRVGSLINARTDIGQRRRHAFRLKPASEHEVRVWKALLGDQCGPDML